MGISKKIRMDPPFWWVDLNDGFLCLLLYGIDFKNCHIESRCEAIEITNFYKPVNSRFLFIDLIIQPGLKPGIYDFHIIEGNSIIEKFTFELKKREKSTTWKIGIDSSDVIYLLMPDRFSQGSADKTIPDGMEKIDRKNPDGRHGGDIKGITKHLNYLKELGITAIWATPVFENNHPAFSYHGYAITDHYAVDPRFGTIDDYIDFVQQCHKNNIKVIADLVFNHCGINHWLIKDLPEPEWIHQFNSYTQTNCRTLLHNDPYKSEFDYNLLERAWFDMHMPDLNHDNQYVNNYLIQNSLWWIENTNIDAIRMDTYPFAKQDFMAEWNTCIKKNYPEFSIIAEIWSEEIAVTAKLQQGPIQRNKESAAPDHVTDFPLCFAILQALTEHDGWRKGMERIYYTLAQDFVYTDPSKNIIFLDNHDLTRIYTALDYNLNKLKLAFTFLLTTRGIPQLYYGSEILMDGFEYKGHGTIRKDFPGGWEGDARNAFTRKGRTKDEQEFYSFLTQLLLWRKTKKSVSKGKLIQFVPENGFYVYFRMLENEKIMIILNNQETRTFFAERYSECIQGSSKGVDILSGKEYLTLNQFEVHAKSALVLEIFT